MREGKPGAANRLSLQPSSLRTKCAAIHHMRDTSTLERDLYLKFICRQRIQLSTLDTSIIQLYTPIDILQPRNLHLLLMF